MSQPLRAASVLAERNLRARLQFAGRYVQVATVDVIAVLAELDRQRHLAEQFAAAAVAALEAPKVGQTVTPAPLVRGAGR